MTDTPNVPNMQPNSQTQDTMNKADETIKKNIGGLTTMLENIFKNFPKLPKALLDFIAQYGPWIQVLVVILGGLTILRILGISVLFGTSTYRYSTEIVYWFALVAGVIVVALNLASLPGLFARKMQGWNFVYYGTLFNILYDLLTFNILVALISFFVGLWIWFQMKPYYK